jgi:SAM-dependent methyltransferase
MIEEAQRRAAGLGRASFRVGDIEALPLDDASVDQVICLAVIEYLATPDRAFSEISRVLRPGGIAIVTTPKRIHLEGVMLSLTAPVRWALRAIAGKEGPGVRRIGYQPSELDRHARAAGLLLDGGSHYLFTPVPYPFTRVFPRLAMTLDLPFERWHATRNPLVGFLAQGYVARYRRPAGA